MTAVATVDDLDHLDLGTVVTVGNNASHWLKEAQGWTRFGITLDARHFAGDIKQGRVTVGVAPEVGQVLPHPDQSLYSYVLLLPHETRAGEWHAALMHEGRFQRITHVDPASLGNLVTDPPAWAVPVRELGTLLLTKSRELDASLTRETEAQQQINRINAEGNVALTEFRAAMTTTLHSFMGGDPIQEEAIMAALRQHGLPLPLAQVKVTIAAQGLTAVEVPVEKVADLVPEATVTSVPGTVYVRWQKELVHSFEAEGGTCTCPQVTRRLVRDLLREAGITVHSDLTYTVRCENGHDDPF